MLIEPGIYGDLSNEDYHASHGLSSSGVKLLLDCPKHYWYRYLSGEYKEKSTPDLIFGSAVHTAILEPFKDLKKLYPKLKEDKLADIKKIADSVYELPIVEAQMIKGNIENSLYWLDECGVLCKTRPDFFNGRCVIEIKTTRDASKDAFSRAIHSYGYHIQAAMQLDGIETVTGNRPEYFIFIAIEKEQPFIAAAYFLSARDIEQGRRLYKKALGIYKGCDEQHKWHGYSDQLEEITMPAWGLDADLKEVDYV